MSTFFIMYVMLPKIYVECSVFLCNVFDVDSETVSLYAYSIFADVYIIFADVCKPVLCSQLNCNCLCFYFQTNLMSV